jgi:hypothetical protein
MFDTVRDLQNFFVDFLQRLLDQLINFLGFCIRSPCFQRENRSTKFKLGDDKINPFSPASKSVQEITNYSKRRFCNLIKSASYDKGVK